MKKFLLSIFAVMLAVFSVQAEVVTFTANAAGTVGTESTGSEVVLENGAVRVVLSKAYGNGTQFRIYSGCSLTVTGTNVTITGVEFTAYNNKKGDITLTSGGGNITSSGDVRSWAGSSNEIVLSAGGQIRTQSITVTYETGEGGGGTPVPAFNPVSGTTFEESLEVVITATDGAAIHYTLNGEEPTTDSETYSAPIVIYETSTVKAIAVVDGVSSSVAEATYTKLINLNGCSVADAIEAYGNGQTGNATIVGYIVGAANSSLSKAEFTSETAVASNILIADDPNETDVAKCMPIKLASETTVRNVLNLSENKGVYKKKVAIECVLDAYFSVAGTQNVSAAGIYWNVSEAGYATLYLGYKAVIPETVKAYLATGVAGKYVALSEVTGILPANTGLILEGEGEHLFNITSSAATVDVDANLLTGTLTDTEITKEAGNSYYILADGEEGIGFYNPIYDGDEAKFNNAANKAYLVVPAEQAEGIACYSFRFGEGTTGIEEITENREQSTVIYDLTGRRVEAITAPGIYVVNGKKVLVK